MAGKVVLRAPSGTIYDVDEKAASDLELKGYSRLSTEEIKQADLENEYKDSPMLAGAAGAARGASFGLSDLAIGAFGGSEDLRALKEQNPTASTVGEIAGGIGSLALPGAGLVGAASKVGASTAKLAGSTSASLVQRAAAKGLGSAAEGALYGAGQTVTEAVLGDPSKAAENLVGNIGLSALLGGGLGVAMEAGSPVLKAGLGKVGEVAKNVLPGAKATVDEAGNVIPGTELSRKVNEYTAKFSSIFGTDKDDYLQVLNMGPQGRVAAREDAKRFVTGDADEIASKLGDLDSNLKERVGEMYSEAQTSMLLQNIENPSVLADAAAKFKGKIDEAFKLVADSPEFYQAETGKIINKSSKVLNNETPTYKTLEKKLEEAMKSSVGPDGMPLPTDNDLVVDLTKAIEFERAKSLLNVRRYLADGMDFNKQITGTADDLKLLTGLYEDVNKQIASLPGGAALREQDGIWSEFSKKHKNFFSEFMKRQPDGTKSIDLQKAILSMKAGGAKGTKIDDLIASMDEFGTKIDAPEILEELNVLKSIREQLGTMRKIEALKVNLGPSGRGALLGGAIMGGAPGAAVTAALAPAIAPSTYVNAVDNVFMLAGLERGSKSFASRMGEGVQGAVDALLKRGAGTSLRIASQSALDRYDFGDKEQKSAAYSDRLETLSRYAANPVQFAEKLTANLGGANDAAPAVSLQAIATVNRAVQFLHSKAPKDTLPSTELIPTKRKFEPTKTEISRFGRYVEAVENPASVLEDLSTGTLSREAVEALRTVYPNMYAEVQAQITQRLAEVDSELPHAAKVQLGILFGIPTMPSMQQQFLAVIQAGFNSAQNEAVTEGVSGQTQSRVSSSGMKNLGIADRSETNLNKILTKG